MIDHIHGKIVFICDGCDDTLETDTSSFIAASKIRQSAKWRVRHSAEGFTHHCPTCRTTEDEW